MEDLFNGTIPFEEWELTHDEYTRLAVDLLEEGAVWDGRCTCCGYGIIKYNDGTLCRCKGFKKKT